MPLATRAPIRNAAPELALPPPFTAGAAARGRRRLCPCQCDRGRSSGAGTLVYVGRFDLAEFAVVLEPEEPLRSARRAFYAGMAALADALTAYAPPESRSTSTGRTRFTSNLRAGRRRAARLAGRAPRGRGAALAGVRRHDPHRVDDRQRAGRCIRSSPRSRRKASTSVDRRRTDRKLRAASHGARSMPGRRAASTRWRSAYLRAARRAREACAATSTTTAICCVRRSPARPSATQLVPALAAPSWLDPSTRRRGRMKLLRTIRLDPSDTFVFERAAEPGEWAVSGAFVFWHSDPDRAAKARRARRSAAAFSASQSLGWSTLVQIVEASDGERAALVDTLAQQLVAHFGAPDHRGGARAAEEEVAFAESLCTQPQDTLIAVHRTFEDGEVREAFRTLRPRAAQKPVRAFSFLEVEGEDEAGRGGRSDRRWRSAKANEGFLALLRPSSARPRRGRRARRHRRVPEGLSGAAGA